MRIVSHVKGESFVHKYLWRIVERQLEHAQRVPSGAFYDDLVAMMFAFNALEAYLNYVGEKIAPDIWVDERGYFRKEPYRGFAGKIRKVYELVGLQEPDKDQRPYNAVWLLKQLRDLMAHGKVENIEGVFEHDIVGAPPWVTTNLDALVTEENAMVVHEDVQVVAQAIHDAARPFINDVWFGSSPFTGPLQHDESHSELINRDAVQAETGEIIDEP